MGAREKFWAFCAERTVFVKASSEFEGRNMRLGSDESVYRELATLKVGDCGGDAKADIFGSVSAQREKPLIDEGGET
jgi:hypothetical protein